jgi:hypothetical protein
MKNNSIQKYFAQAERMGERKFHSLEGYGTPSDFEFADDAAGSGVPAASAPAGGNVLETSSPYVINITATAITANVVIFNAFNAIQYAVVAAGGNLQYGNGANISITSGIAGTSYIQMLYEAMNRPFVVGLTYLYSATAGQVIQPMGITESNAKGESQTRPLINVQDPYQFQPNSIAQKKIFKVDGFTSITISSMLVGTLSLYLYPSFDADTARSLSNGQMNQGYGKPGVIREQKITIPQLAQ